MKLAAFIVTAAAIGIPLYTLAIAAFGLPAVAVTLAGLTALVCWDIAHAPVMDVES